MEKDAELVRAMQQGSQEAFEKLFVRYREEALRTVYLMIHSQADSEDIVQNAFLHCYYHAGEIREPEFFKSWFFRMLTRMTWRYCQKQKREQPVEEIFQAETASPEPSPLECYLESEQSIALYKEVLKLPAKQRMVTILYYYNEMTTAEIARSTGLREGTVRTRLFHARKALRKALGDAGDCEEPEKISKGWEAKYYERRI
ncbi:MAG: RNA polymerase sigma factor [Eubacteriales bacterium]|nr:RNA polymerase sigma factor [Eubacteriales bacterium]